MDYAKLIKITDSAVSHSFVVLHTIRSGYSPDQLGSTLSVSDFIGALSEYDSNKPILYNNDNGYTFGSVGSIDESDGYVYLDVTREGYTSSQVESTMTIGELISALENCDSSSPVVFRHDDGYTYGEVTYDCITEDESEEESEDTSVEERSDDERILHQLENEDGFSWYRGESIPYGCWYSIESYLLPDDTTALVEKLKKAFPNRVSNFKRKGRSFKFVVWDSPEACEEFSGD